jgi:hypothetical protein
MVIARRKMPGGGIRRQIFAAAEAITPPSGGAGLVLRRTAADGKTRRLVLPGTAAAGALAPGLYADPDNFYAPTIGGGAVAARAGLILRRTDAAGKARRLVLPGAAAPGAVNLAPALYIDPDNFYAPVTAGGGAPPGTGLILRHAAPRRRGATHRKTRRLVLAGAAAIPGDLRPALYVDPDNFYSPVTAGGGAAPGAGLILRHAAPRRRGATHRKTRRLVLAGAPAPGTVDLMPGLYVDPDSLYAATVGVRGAVNLAAGLYPDPDNFYAATVAAAANLAPGRYSDADNFYAPTVAGGAVNLAPGLYADPDNFYAPTAARALAPALYVDPDNFYSPTVRGGAVNLAPGRYVDPDNFFRPVVVRAGVPPDVDDWYPPTILDPLPVVFVARRAGIEDAPQDGRIYGRCNGRWVPIDGSPG